LGAPNKGYTLSGDYDQDDYKNENFPGSVQTHVTGINDHNVTVGFWVDSNNANLVNNNFGFVDQNGVFTKVVDPLGKQRCRWWQDRRTASRRERPQRSGRLLD
jgi:hypothetical protein